MKILDIKCEFAYIDSAKIYKMPIFRDYNLFLYFCDCAKGCAEAGLDNQGNIYFLHNNGIVERFNRKEFVRKFKETYTYVELTMKDDIKNNECLTLPDWASKSVRIVLLDKRGLYITEESVIVSGLFLKWGGCWDGLQWHSKRYLVLKEYANRIKENDLYNVRKIEII